ncbi:TFIIB-type zinc ribbon-containing protein [Aeromicrobium sp. P5_D10]
MKCPTDNAVLVMSERSGIEIDYCPECRGVWLDRGELDKIIDRAASESVAPAAAPAPQQYAQPRYDERPRSGHQQPYRKKKESWLSELFD